MKTTTLPSLRVNPAVREQAEALLAEGETLSAFVLESITRNIELRSLHQQFVQRGLASAANAKQSGVYVSAASVIQKMERKLKTAQRKARPSS